MLSSIIVLVKIVLALVLIYLSIAVIFVFSERPSSSTGDTLDFSRMNESDKADTPVLVYTARDGAKLHYRQYGQASGPLIVVVHGSSAHGGLYEKLSSGLQDLGTVVVPDLRGHGDQEPSGDVNYIGQLEDDLADFIQATRTSADQKVILVGHSSGGGLVVRFCGNTKHHKPDAVVLLAPYLGFNSPTVRADSGGWAEPLVRRSIGLSMLNGLKIKILNHFPVITFRLPEGAEELNMTSSYSYRMNTSFAPRYDFKKDMAGLPQFTIIVGQNDEAFVAEEFSPLVTSLELNGDVQILDGLSHLDVIGDGLVHEQIAEFVATVN